MLDIPVNKNIVSFSDLAKYNVSTFGADEIIRHLTGGGDAVMPILPGDSIFMNQFWRTVAQQEQAGAEDDEDNDSGREGSDEPDK